MISTKTCWLELSVREEFSAANGSARVREASSARCNENFPCLKSSICCVNQIKYNQKKYLQCRRLEQVHQCFLFALSKPNIHAKSAKCKYNSSKVPHNEQMICKTCQQMAETIQLLFKQTFLDQDYDLAKMGRKGLADFLHVFI